MRTRIRCRAVDENARASKKIREARRLRDVPPERTLQMAFDLIRVTRELNGAADDARP